MVLGITLSLLLTGPSLKPCHNFLLHFLQLPNRHPQNF